MDLKQFENNINKKFKDFEPEVDSLKIWDNIENDLPQPKRSKSAWWFALLLIPVGMFYFVSQDSKSFKHSYSNELSENLIDNKDAIVPHASKVDSKILENESLTSISNTTNLNNKTQVARSNNDDSKAVKTFAEAEKSLNEETKRINVTSNSPITSQPKKVLVNPETTTSTIDKQQSNNLLSEATINKIVEATTPNVIDEEKQQVSETVAKDELEKGEETEVQDEISISENDNSVKKSDVAAAEELSNAVEKEMKDQIVQEEDLPGLGEDSPNKSEVIMPQKRLSIGFLAGVLGSNRIYEAPISPDVERTIAEKETAEKQLETMQFELVAKYRITPRISLGLGLRNWKLSEKSMYTTEREYTALAEVVTGITHHADGTIEETTSQVPVHFHESVENTRYQSHQSWAVPIRAYFAMVNTERFEVELAGGYEHSFSGKHIGYELDANATEYLMTQDANAQYNKNGGNYLLLDINTNYKLKNSLALTAGLEGKYGLNGFNTETALYRKKYHFFGAYAGLSYSF